MPKARISTSTTFESQFYSNNFIIHVQIKRPYEIAYRLDNESSIVGLRIK